MELSTMNIGKIYLEGMMYRCGILSSIGYRFSGFIDTALLQESFVAVVGEIKKFRYQIKLDQKDRISWQYKGNYPENPPVIRTDDPESAFIELCAAIFSRYQASNQFPMLLTIIEQTKTNEEAEGQYIVVQTMDHSFCDARSSEFIFKWVVDYYNAILDADKHRQTTVIDTVKNLTTPGSDDIYAMFNSRSLIQLPRRHHLRNLYRIIKYKINDAGQYSVPYRDIEKNLPTYAEKIRRPILRWFDLNPLVEACRKDYPNLNSNSIVCALTAKAIHHINREKNVGQNVISFRMLSDILTPRMRKKYIGNYISYVPVSVDAEQSVCAIAKAIDDWVLEFRDSKLDVSQFKFLEFAIAKRLVGKQDDPVSYSISQVSHRALMKKKQTLNGARFIDIIGGINAEPRDLMGGMMNNKPVICTSLSEQNRLFMTFYPMIGSDEGSLLIVDTIEKVLTDCAVENEFF